MEIGLSPKVRTEIKDERLSLRLIHRHGLKLLKISPKEMRNALGSSGISASIAPIMAIEPTMPVEMDCWTGINGNV